MKRLQILFIILTFLTNLALAQVAADAIRIQAEEEGFGARTLAMGGNGVAAARDYSTVYWNPAGLASLKKNEIFVDYSYKKWTNQATFAGTITNSEQTYSHLRSIGLAVPLPTTRGSFVLGVGYNFVQDYDEYLRFEGFNTRSNRLGFELEDDQGNVDWYPFDKNVQQEEEIVDEGGLHQWSLGMALALSPNLDVGATVNLWRGKDNYRMKFNQWDTADNYSSFPGNYDSYQLHQHIDAEYSALGFKVGAMYKLNPYIRLGGSVEFPIRFTVKENYGSGDILTFDDGYQDAVEDEPGMWEYQVQTPYRFDGGIELGNETVHLTAAVTYRDWSETQFKVPENATLDADYSALLEENSVIAETYRATLNYHLGGEIEFPGTSLAIRGGYSVHPSPLLQATEAMDKKFYSGGIGLDLGGGSRLEVTYIRGEWSRLSEDSYTPGGTMENIIDHRIFTGLRIAF